MPTVADPPMASIIAALIVAIIVAALLGWFCYRLLVDRGHLLLRLPEDEEADARARRQAEGLPAGAYLSDFALPTLSGLADSTRDGAMVALSDLIGRPFLLTFLRADCLFSRAIARELASKPPDPAAPATVSILVGETGGTEALAAFIGLPGVILLDPQGQVARLMRIAATPSGYLIDEGRRTAGKLLAGPVALLAAARGEAVAGNASPPLAISPLPAGSSAMPAPLPVGSAAPDFTLPLAGGGEWSLAAHRGEPLALIFSDPSCPPCAALLAELRSRDTSGVVIVSRGDAGENRRLVAAIGVTAPVLLQRQREVARAYRTLETPAAYLIDERGEIAAGPAIGKEAVLDVLAGAGSVTMHSAD